MKRREPIFNVPGIILAISGLLVLVHVVRTYALSAEAETLATIAAALVPARYTGLADQIPGGDWAAFTAPFTHMVVHADVTHLGVNVAWLVVFGSIVARRLGTIRTILFALFTGLAGALVFVAANWGAIVPMVGASGAVSGLMGGAIRLLHAIMRVGAMRDAATAAYFVPLASIGQTLRDRNVLTIVAVTFVTNIAMGASGSLLTPGGAGIAWEAHLGGFALGLLTFGLFDPGPLPLPPLPEQIEPQEIAAV